MERRARRNLASQLDDALLLLARAPPQNRRIQKAFANLRGQLEFDDGFGEVAGIAPGLEIARVLKDRFDIKVTIALNHDITVGIKIDLEVRLRRLDLARRTAKRDRPMPNRNSRPSTSPRRRPDRPSRPPSRESPPARPAQPP